MSCQEKIENLKKEKLFSLEKIARAKSQRIAALVRPSGYFNQKTRRLQLFCRHVSEKHGAIPDFLQQPTEKLRLELLELHGIGPETADSIILYASQQPVFVVDAYTRRFTERYYEKKMGYAQTQQFFESKLPQKAELFNEYHALLVEHAKKNCKKSPGCTSCSLKKNCKNNQPARI